MNWFKTDDVRIDNIEPLISPAILIKDYPATPSITELVSKSRKAADNIIEGKDDRLLVIVGPCSIHDPEAAIEYANKLKEQMARFDKELSIIMRVYFEKPRTTVGWKGLINDPFLNGSYDINRGLHMARGLLLRIADIGVPSATEFLDTITPQYIADLITWGAIGARTTESQVHRELASGLSMPVGFKNGTTGCLQIAIDAVIAASCPHCFLSVTKQGVSAIVSTTGNKTCHLILRGSSMGPNYSSKDITAAWEKLQKAGVNNHIMIDLSHGNSSKDYHNQPIVAQHIADQISAGDQHIAAVMIESFLVEGSQKISDKMTYGQSVTDQCISWDETVNVLELLAQSVRNRRQVGK
ncbi:MAG: 3-deoxy-7-phosphoheptulonate synthase [Akkermansia sp.]